LFTCGEIGHILINCPNKKEDKYGKKKDNKSVPKRNKYYKKEKNGQAYLLSGIPMQAPMKMMMTSLQEDLPGLLSRKLLHSSPSHIVLWQKVNQR
jgi:hypothetical protein